MCVQPPSCSNASVRSNSAFEYSGSASIMSPQISGNPASRAQPSACVAPAAVWVRPNRRSCASSALCTPKLMRVTPAARKPCSVSGVTTSGFASSVISAPGRGLASFIKSAACSGVISAGVPPPKYSVSGRRLFLASSRSRAST